MADQVVFRRIRGRIIPIKTKSRAGQAAQGAALVGGAAGAVYAVGAKMRALSVTGARALSVETPKLMKFEFQNAQRIAKGWKPLKSTAAKMAKSVGKINAAKATLAAAAKIRSIQPRLALVATAAAAGGLHQLIKAVQPKTPEPVAVGASAVGGTTLIKAASLASYGNRGRFKAYGYLFAKGSLALRKVAAKVL